MRRGGGVFQTARSRNFRATLTKGKKVSFIWSTDQRDVILKNSQRSFRKDPPPISVFNYSASKCGAITVVIIILRPKHALMIRKRFCRKHVY